MKTPQIQDKSQGVAADSLGAGVGGIGAGMQFGHNGYPAHRPATREGSVPGRMAEVGEVGGSGVKPIISLRGVCKSFGDQKVLDQFDLDIPPARTTVIMGPSGCGKSVALKHIVGLLKPDSGEIYFDGQRTDAFSEQELAPVRLQIGLLFQMSALFDSMTVEENIEFPYIEHTKLTPKQRREKVAEALETVDLQGVQPKLPAQLSGGQRKRVALARAIVLRPRVVLYDEPTTGLDPIRSDGINKLILKLNSTLNVTNVVVTHDLVSARAIADRVVMMLNGKIAAAGTFEEVANSKDQRIQHFLAGEYVRDDDDDEQRLEQERQVRLQLEAKKQVNKSQTSERPIEDPLTSSTGMNQQEATSQTHEGEKNQMTKGSEERGQG
jgi:phospholipid/cholesterol/gamma-HCH transport system ATP-binding protein